MANEKDPQLASLRRIERLLEELSIKATELKWAVYGLFFAGVIAKAIAYLITRAWS